jgi:hypothetical protein
MARGVWDDFTEKYGFGDGAGVEQRDFDAREIIISKLNGLPAFKVSNVRAVAYDRPGVHNPCLIILLPNLDGKPDDQLLADWIANKIEALQLPEGDYDIEELVCESYEELEIGSLVAESKPKLQLLSRRKRKSR